MFYICGVKFDVTNNMKKFANFFKTKQDATPSTCNSYWNGQKPEITHDHITQLARLASVL